MVRIEVPDVRDAAAGVDALLHLSETATEPADRLRYRRLAHEVSDGLDALPWPGVPPVDRGGPPAHHPV
jgi:hypothetical protein